MFLTIGEKVKFCREIYHIKQISFSKFGISQNYLSMIESHKRQPTLEVIDQIYDAFEQLTERRIQSYYDKESFRQTPHEQANLFLHARCKNEPINAHFEDSVRIASEYEVTEVLYELNFLMGKNYQKLLQYETSDQYFMTALHEAIKKEMNLAYAYRELAFNAKQTLNYKVALNYYLLAAQYTEDKTSDFFYKGESSIAFIYIELRQFESAINIINQIIQDCRFPEIAAGTYMYKYYAYYKQGQWEMAKVIMAEFIEKNIYPPCLVAAYHNLAEGYYQLKNYENAMKNIDQAIILRKNDNRSYLSEFVKGKIYHELGEYEKAKQYYEQTRHPMITNSFYEYIQEWYRADIKLLHELGDHQKVLLSLDEIKKRTLSGTISKQFLNEVKLELIQWKSDWLNQSYQDEKAYYLAILNT